GLLVGAEAAVEAVVVSVAADQVVVARLAADAIIARLTVEDVVAVAAGDVVAVVEDAQREPVVGAVGEHGKALDRIAGVAARVLPVGVRDPRSARDRRARQGKAVAPDEIVA